MTFNIVEAIESKISTDQIENIAESTRESPSKTRQVMSLGVVAIVENLIRRASSPSGAAGLLGSLSGGATARSLLGEQAESTTEALSRSGGVSRGAASSILASLAPIAAGVLGHEARARQLDAGGLADMLSSQKRFVSTSTRTIEGAEDVSVSSTPRPPISRVMTPAIPKRRSPWLPLAIGAVALIVVAGFAFRNKTEAPNMGGPETAKLGAPTAPDLPPGGPEIPAAPEVSTPTLTGAEVPGKVQEKPAAQADDLTSKFNGTGALPERIELPGVKFEFASTTLAGGADSELDRLATILKDKPSAKIRLEGNTDSVGDPDLNARLSYARAKTVKKELVDRGVDQKQLETIGKRDSAPISPNSTAEGRAANRRVDAVLLAR